MYNIAAGILLFFSRSITSSTRCCTSSSQLTLSHPRYTTSPQKYRYFKKSIVIPTAINVILATMLYVVPTISLMAFGIMLFVRQLSLSSREYRYFFRNVVNHDDDNKDRSSDITHRPSNVVYRGDDLRYRRRNIAIFSAITLFLPASCLSRRRSMISQRK